jgi:hypothetical protein
VTRRCATVTRKRAFNGNVVVAEALAQANVLFKDWIITIIPTQKKNC